VVMRQLKAEVAHTRSRPLRHQLKTSTTWFEIDLNNLCALNFLSTFPYVFNSSDHGLLKDHGDDTYEKLKKYALSRHLKWPDQARVLLYTHLRVLGYNFNPISLYFVFAQDSDLKFVLAEVSNTYKEQKVYALTQKNSKGHFELSIPKNFYISPFINVKSHLEIHVRWDPLNLFAQVKSFEDDQLTLSATVTGKIVPSTFKTRVASFFYHPFGALRVMALIHWNAFVLYLKGVHFYKKSENIHYQQDILYAQNDRTNKKN